MKRIVTFAAVCGFLVVGTILLLLTVGGLSVGDLHGNGLVAAIFCVVFPSALGIALMALIFASDRSDHDEAVYHLELGSGRSKPDRDASSGAR
jgi:hypothetical protein